MRSKARTRALIVKREERGYVALTPEGDFCYLPLSVGEVPVGAEVEVKNGQSSWTRGLALAACILLALLGWQLYLAVLPAAAAYVSLDINPSWELAVDAEGQVVKVTSLDQEGQELIRGLRLKKKPVDEAMAAVIRAAVDQGYIAPEGAVLVTLAPVAGKERLPLAAEQVAGSIEAALQANNAATRILVTSASAQERAEARDLGISTGKYILAEVAREKGKPLPAAELAGESIKELEARYRIRAEELLQERARQGKPGTVILKKPRPQLPPGQVRDKGLPATLPAEGGPAGAPGQQKDRARPPAIEQPEAVLESEAGKDILPRGDKKEVPAGRPGVIPPVREEGKLPGRGKSAAGTGND